MSDEYSTYEAKAKFSEVLRKVRQGRRVTVTYYGEPVAEIVPVVRRGQGLAARVEHLTSIGAILPATGRIADLKPLARRPGALKRFLEERD